MKNWTVVAISTTTRRKYGIVDDINALRSLYEEHAKDIWIGHNVVHYDQYILKGILLGLDPYWISTKIIKEHMEGWQISRAFNKLPLILFDTMIASPNGLKTLEGFMGNDIRESDVDFDIDRPLTDEEIRDTLKYCTHDVEQDMEVFLKKIEEFNASMSLIETFPDELTIYDLYRTKPQLSAKILGCSRSRDGSDEFDVSVLPCIQLNRYRDAVDFFLNPENHWYKRGTVKNEYKIVVAGIPHKLGWGGIHGAKEKIRVDCNDRIILHIDVASFYPRLMIFWGLLTRNCSNPSKFRDIFERRLKLKREGKKKEQAPLKIVINSTYGMCKDKGSTAYDPRQANMITMNGQLMLLDLIEHLEEVPGFELIQSNTDGLIISIPDNDESFDMVDDICYEWETRCRMELEFDQIKWICQKDVNNYIFEFSNGKLEKKGAYVKDLNDLDNDLPIVNKAIVDFISKGVPVETTIGGCSELIQFQKIVKRTSNYVKVIHNGVEYSNKCFRVFASKDLGDGRICKCKLVDGSLRLEKFANTPDNCFIDNRDIKGRIPPDKLDRMWYINKAITRLREFGIEVTK